MDITKPILLNRETTAENSRIILHNYCNHNNYKKKMLKFIKMTQDKTKRKWLTCNI